MLHDLYLRAHVVVSGDASDHKEKRATRLGFPKLWPTYALVFDTETAILDLNQPLTFGAWRFCELQGSEYVAIQEGIFYSDELTPKDV
jgi:hypothetical protein